jgi:hypothetical protein
MFGLFKKASQAKPAVAAEIGTSAPPEISIGRAFCQNGYVRLPQVFGAEDIAAFRAAAIGVLPASAPPYQPQFSNTALFGEPFRPIFRNPQLNDGLQTLLGDDFLFLNEFSLQDSHFSGWHTDTTSPEAKAGHEFHWSPGFLLVNVAIYLQDNKGNGGGLDVVPRSHLRDDPLAVTMRGGQVENPYGDAITIDSKAGDVVIFHLRVSHRSSLVTSAPSNDAERKLALFLIAGANNAMTQRYRLWIDQYAKMNGDARPAIPDEFRAFASNSGLRIL